ncbi:thiol reductant ABC exporter subunit CydC [Aeromicrobium sp. YIM 150415]|uniref:thiol reductant ABC exporter subunit CydC n=1 Tax=Aeromicrobium sp. YIM 150415 TaxID=2803912 RepID=UPI001963D172|nr:thiol reductant ABC exporter subunit CydC [Aeromicrobium sp. YIM 150415]MBM9462797.1 thiol reductant ABC exporter subunit CydC [Aeromicrobium sp. YIM 150415]
MTGRAGRLGLGVLMGVLAQLSAIGLLLAAAWLIVRAAQQPPVLYLMVAIVSVRAFGIARAVFRYVERLMTHDVALRDATTDRVEVYRQLNRIAPAGLTGQRRGDVVSRVVSDVQTRQDRLLRVGLPWWTGLLASVVVIGVVAALDLRSGLVVAGGVVVSAVAIRSTVARIAARRDGRRAAAARGRLAADVSQIVLAGPDLVAFGAGDRFRAETGRSVTELAGAQRRGAGAVGLASAIVLAVTGAAVALVAAWSAGASVVVVGVLVLAPIALSEPLEAWGDAERHRPAVDDADTRIAALTALPAPIAEPDQSTALPSAWSLRLRGLAVGWESTLVDGIDLDVNEGEIVAITGPSGIGKSTLAYTLLRLIEPRAGSIQLGDVDVRELGSDDVRGRIGYLGQDEIIFDTTIRENLRIADPEAGDESAMTALDRAGLGEFVRSLPRGLDTPVGEHGSRLSGGERQRLALARLLLGDHRIVVLDEPTEHLDAPTARALLDDLLALAPDRSVIVISHAPEVLDRIDRVIRLDAASVRV